MATLQGETTLIFGVEIQAFDGRTSQFIHFNVLKVKLIKKLRQPFKASFVSYN